MSKDPAFLFYSKDLKIIKSEWNTENTYDFNYKPKPNKPGVHLIVAITFISFGYDIIYVGSSCNLKNRYKNHEVIRSESNNYDHIQFYFKECDNYLEIEKKLIKVIQPKLNVQWR